MNIKKIDHIGIAVKSLADGQNLWSDILGLNFLGKETVDAQKVTTAFFNLGETKIELLEATADDSPVAKFINKKGEGIQHIGLLVDNLAEALDELKEKGVRLIDEKPRKGAKGKMIAFLHPKATNGVLVELCEK